MLCDRWGVGQTSITVRDSEPGDLRECEEIIRDAFWNVYRPGCFEHFIWHKALSGHPDLRQSLVAIVEGRIAGCLMSTTAHIKGSTSAGTPVIAIGPLGVRPTLQGQGVGSRLMSEALSRARSDGELGAFLYGDPAFYGRFGFEDAVRWQITTAQGDNFPAFMGRELQPNGLTRIQGRLVESAVLEVDEPAVAAFDADFPARAKLRLPGQL